MKRFAESLKHAREIRGITIQDISKQTRINIKFIEAIEDANFKILPQTYIRAFIRAYAKCVGLNPDEILEHYQMALSGKSDISQTPKITKPIETISPSIQNVSDVYQDDTPIKKLEEYLASVKTLDKPKDAEKIEDKKDDLKQRESRKYSRKKINIPGISILLALIVIVTVIVMFYFSPKKESKIEEQPFENVLKETLDKYSPRKTVDSVQKKRADSLNLAYSRIKPDSLTLGLQSDIDLWVSIRMDNVRSFKGLLTANNKNLYRAKEKFIVTANKGKNLKIFLDEKFLGNLSNSDSLRSTSISIEGLKPVKIEKKPLPKKQDELKPLEIKPIDSSRF